MIADVVIAGAGPNGSMLACELSLAGVRPIVLERLPGISDEPRANGLVGQVVPMLDRRGLYERLSGSTEPPRPSPAYMFAALPLELSALRDNPIHLLLAPQREITRVLQERAIELGAEIRGGHELVGMSQEDDSVTVDVVGPDGPYRLHAGYLVGADGGRSLTRKLAGIDFPGVTTENLVSRTANATVPAEWVDPVMRTLTIPGYGTIPIFMHHRTERGLFVYAPLPNRAPVVSVAEWGQSATDEPMTLEELRASIGRVLGVDVPLEPPTGDGPHLLRRLTGGNTRLAQRFRDRRVLLVGDAAHVHSAIGGPGLNLGLQDAVNLGWKLAAQIRGSAPPGLLDTYETERRPVAQRVIMHTRAQSALIAPGSGVTALRELFTELLADPHNVAHIAHLIAGSDIRYDMGTGDAHPLVGRWAPDMVLHNGTETVRLAELTRDAQPLLIDWTEDGAAAHELSTMDDRVTIIRTHPPTPEIPATALLLRPDCYIAWASASPRPNPTELHTLRTALHRWLTTTTPALT
jgi:2-polyprenyl-6-methoxyphenol hydroxylase-like FAD-dependent oxidoreductase